MKEGSKKRIAKIGMKPKNEAKRARMDGSKKSRKSSKQGSKGRKEGRKEGNKEGRKEGNGSGKKIPKECVMVN